MRVNDSAKKRIYQENTTWEQDSKCNETDIKTRRVWDDMKSEKQENPNSICSVTKAKGKYFKERLNASKAGFGNKETSGHCFTGIRSKSWIIGITGEYNTFQTKWLI